MSTEPFDMGAPPAELPSGSSNLPFQFPDNSSRPIIDHDEMVREARARGPYGRSDFEALDNETKAVVIEWWPKLFMEQVADGKFILTVFGLLDYIESHKLKEKAAKTAQGVTATRYLDWVNECAARQKWIDEKGAEWKRRVAAKKAAMAQWDSYVAEAREDYTNAKAYPAPPRPV